MQCTINDKIATGMGPNKKTAKKNAAENMLRTMGHAPSVSQLNRKLKPDVMKYFRLSNLTMKINQLIKNKNLNQSNQRFHQSHHRSLPPQPVRYINYYVINYVIFISGGNVVSGGGVPAQPSLGQVAESQLQYLASLQGYKVTFSDFPKDGRFLR